MPQENALTEADVSHLQLLAIFYYIDAGLTFLFGCFPLIYVFLGVAMLSNAEFVQEMQSFDSHSYQSHEEMQEDVLFGGESPLEPVQVEAETQPEVETAEVAVSQADHGTKLVGGILTGVGAVMSLGLWLYAALLIVTGRSLQKRRRILFCQVIAGLSCIMIPIGTVLGIFTIVVLQRPAVAAAFQRK